MTTTLTWCPPNATFFPRSSLNLTRPRPSFLEQRTTEKILNSSSTPEPEPKVQPYELLSLVQRQVADAGTNARTFSKPGYGWFDEPLILSHGGPILLSSNLGSSVPIHRQTVQDLSSELFHSEVLGHRSCRYHLDQTPTSTLLMPTITQPPALPCKLKSRPKAGAVSEKLQRLRDRRPAGSIKAPSSFPRHYH